ncbi:MAG: segregation/condensation protein A [Candidatus Micrarchaeaceae archaeon]
MDAPAQTGSINLQEFVKSATWRELLMELVDTERLDPWDIDIVKVVDSYITMVRKMQVMDLHVPANIILAASILLRMKSETINMLQVDSEPEPEDVRQAARVLPEVPNLMPRLRLQPRRRVTLSELMDALGDAIKINERREIVVRQMAEPLNIVIDKDDIDEKLMAAHRMVKGSVDSEGVTTFSALSKGFGSIERVLLDLFVPLLFLAHKGDVLLVQDEFFDEIFVRLCGDGSGKGK